ncbi:amidase [Microlunatus sp. Gsoil 973]|uniref:amidase n=1 Tax=Microlunatus sp. Gsoil 973 TaxID=2672569 RepID=UPI0012B45A1C|nr:amidase [Microlunatus sp. Gsoil 973]QGN32878.1 amidase [Microlunatus sp. Gsoil 973]
MADRDRIADLDAVGQRAGYLSGELSPVEVAEAALARIAAAEPVLNAMQIVYADHALAAARASEKRWADGDPRGPLDGVTVTIKENVDVAGEPTRWGTAASPPVPAARTAPIAERLSAGGAVILGKTTMPDWGMLSSGVSSLHETTRNPWNPDWNPGGSSSGAGAATAAGYAPLNFGSDIGGSIRLPATWNGCVGFKPSYGRIPVDPSYTGRTIGPLARIVADIALAMPVVSGPDERDPYSLPEQLIDWTDAGFDPHAVRIGLLLDAGTGTPVADEVRTAVAAAADVFADAGATVEPLDPFLTTRLLQQVDLFWRVGHWNDYLNLPAERRGLLLPFIAEWCLAGKELGGPEATAGANAQIEVARRTLAATAGFDLVLSPAAPEPTYPAEWPMPSNDVDHAMDHIGFCMPYNMSGQPAISINCGFTGDGRPIGVQIAARRFDDRGALAAAAFFETNRPEAAVRPWPRISRHN